MFDKPLTYNPFEFLVVWVNFYLRMHILGVQRCNSHMWSDTVFRVLSPKLISDQRIWYIFFFWKGRNKVWSNAFYGIERLFFYLGFSHMLVLIGVCGIGEWTPFFFLNDGGTPCTDKPWVSSVAFWYSIQVFVNIYCKYS